MKSKQRQMKNLLKNVEVLDHVPANFQDQLNERKNTRRELNRYYGEDEYTRFQGWEPSLVRKVKIENDLQIAQMVENKIVAAKEKFGEVWPHAAEKFEVGAVFVNSWGWEQTNIDFYAIVAMTEKTVTLLPMTKNVSAEVGFMTNYVLPAEIDWTADPIVKRKKMSPMAGEPNINFSYGWTPLWKGDKVTESHYA